MLSGLVEENQRRYAAGVKPFMDIGQPAPIAGEKDYEVSHSSGSPRNEIVESMDCKSIIKPPNIREIGRKELLEHDDQEEGPENQQDQLATGSRWVPNKVARFGSTTTDTTTSRDEEQASETMSMIRKARVSVRARSDASMVISSIIYII